MFLDEVAVRQRGPKDWVLLEPLRYQGRDERFTVPEGFVTDFASVPRALVWLLPRYGLYTRAAILHDHLLRSREVSVRDADGVFRRSMRELGVSVPRRWMMWAAVRVAAGFAGSSPREVLAVLAVAVPSLVVLAAPALLVQLTLFVFWGVEWLVWGGQRVGGVPAQSPGPPVRVV